MASVTQKIPNYVAGISEQPDELKFPGQVRDLLNCVPDVTKQLIKRPGSRFLINVRDETDAEWFSYYRDEAEQYIGCVRTNGQVHIYNTVTQQEVTWDPAGSQTLAYLAHTAPDAIQFLTVNDFTFVTNREEIPRMLPEGTANSTRAVEAYAPQYTGGAGNATNVATTNITGTGNGMTVDVTTTGNNTITGLTINTAGTGYSNGDRFTINGYPNAAGVFTDDAKSQPEVPEGYVEVKILAYGREYSFEVFDANGTNIGQPSFSTTADPTLQISVGAILTAWETDLQALGFSTSVIGNGIYFTRGAEFSINVIDTQTMNGFTDNVNSFDRLPYQCHDGMIVEIANTDSTDEDNFYVVFRGDNGNDGVGIWEETVAPDLFIRFDPATMPHQLRRNANGTFTGLEITWPPLPAGNYSTNPPPAFIDVDDPTSATAGSPINKMLLFRNRLCFLSQENVSTSQAGGFFDLFSDSVIAISPQDPIQVAASSNQPAVLFDGLEINNGLVLFGETQQYLLSSEDSAVGLTQETVKLSSIGNFLYDRQIRPVSLGTTVAFTNMGGSSFRCFEMANIDLQGEPNVTELSKVVSLLLPNNLVSIADSKEGNLLMFAGDDTGRENEVWGYRYYNVGDERKQSAWFRWELAGNILYHTIMRDTYYAVVRINDENKILAFDIKETENTALINDDFRVHLDNRVNIDVSAANVTFDASARETTFDIPPNEIENFTDLTILRNQVLIDVSSDTDVATTNVRGTGTGLTVDVTVNANEQITNVTINDDGTGYFNGDTFTIDGYPGSLIQYEHGQVYAFSLVDGDYDTVAINTGVTPWRGTVDGDWRNRDFVIGYLFDMRVDIPRFYVVADEPAAVRSDTRASLVIHRFNIEAGATGVFDATLKRTGYDDYTETYYPIVANAYLANSPMIAESLTRIIPCYIRNKQMDVELHSRHPSPFTLFSISWEGDFSNKYYRSV